MMATDTERRDPVTVVLEENVPVRLDWNGVRYYVDAPPQPRGRLAVTPPSEPLDPSLVTGWRFAASSVDGESHIFEVTSCGGARWCLTRLDS